MKRLLKGFTLIELLIVIAIIGILTVALLPQVLQAPAKARDAAKTKVVQDIKAGVEMYISKGGSYPTQSTSGVVDNTVAGSLDLVPSIAASNSYYFCSKPSATPPFYAIGFTPEVTKTANSDQVLSTSFPDAATCNDGTSTVNVGTASYVITNQ